MTPQEFIKTFEDQLSLGAKNALLRNKGYAKTEPHKFESICDLSDKFRKGRLFPALLRVSGLGRKRIREIRNILEENKHLLSKEELDKFNQW